MTRTMVPWSEDHSDDMEPKSDSAAAATRFADTDLADHLSAVLARIGLRGRWLVFADDMPHVPFDVSGRYQRFSDDGRNMPFRRNHPLTI